MRDGLCVLEEKSCFKLLGVLLMTLEKNWGRASSRGFDLLLFPAYEQSVLTPGTPEGVPSEGIYSSLTRSH